MEIQQRAKVNEGAAFLRKGNISISKDVSNRIEFCRYL